MKLFVLFSLSFGAPLQKPHSEVIIVYGTFSTSHQIEQTQRIFGAGTRKSASDVPNLRPAVADFVKEYLLRNGQEQWIVDCVNKPDACEKSKFD